MGERRERVQMKPSEAQKEPDSDPMITGEQKGESTWEADVPAVITVGITD